MPAAVAAAVVAFFVMMVVTVHIWIKCKISCEECHNCIICTSRHAAIKLNPCFCQRHLCAPANAAVDQHIHLLFRKHTRQSAVTASLGADNLCIHDFSIGNFINLKLFCMSKMLEYIPFFISNCNFQRFYLPSAYALVF